MSDFFEWLGDWCPIFLWAIIWAILAVPRFLLMCFFPKNSQEWHHKLHKFYSFLAFQRG